MNRKKVPAIPEALEKVRGQFETWRATQKKRSPIPEPLWQAAVELSQDLGISKVARGLRLDYYTLKKRAHPSTMVPKPGRSGFVEFTLPPPPVSTEWVVEMETPQGATMKLHHKGPGGAELVASLLSTFWRH